MSENFTARSSTRLRADRLAGLLGQRLALYRERQDHRQCVRDFAWRLAPSHRPLRDLGAFLAAIVLVALVRGEHPTLSVVLAGDSWPGPGQTADIVSEVGAAAQDLTPWLPIYLGIGLTALRIGQRATDGNLTEDIFEVAARWDVDDLLALLVRRDDVLFAVATLVVAAAAGWAPLTVSAGAVLASLIAERLIMGGVLALVRHHRRAAA